MERAKLLLLDCLPLGGWSTSALTILPPTRWTILPPTRQMEQICSYYTASHSADGANRPPSVLPIRFRKPCGPNSAKQTAWFVLWPPAIGPTYTASHSADGANLLLLYCLALGGWSKSALTILPRTRWTEQICSHSVDGANLLLLYCLALNGWSKYASTILPPTRRMKQICS